MGRKRTKPAHLRTHRETVLRERLLRVDAPLSAEEYLAGSPLCVDCLVERVATSGDVCLDCRNARELRFDEDLAEAMWAGDVDRLHELAPCGCCCHEHTFAWCEARIWGGCRSGLAPGEDLYEWGESWRQHYGMSEKEFYGYE